MGRRLAAWPSTDCHRKLGIDKGCVLLDLCVRSLECMSARIFCQNLDLISQISSFSFNNTLFTHPRYRLLFTLRSVQNSVYWRWRNFSCGGSNKSLPMSSVTCNIDEWSEFEMSAFQLPAFPWLIYWKKSSSINNGWRRMTEGSGASGWSTGSDYCLETWTGQVARIPQVPSTDASSLQPTHWLMCFHYVTVCNVCVCTVCVCV